MRDAGVPRKVEIPVCQAALRQTGDGGDVIDGQSLQVDATPPASRPLLRFAALLLVCAGCFAAPAAAQADDLIQLNGDPPVTLSGGMSFGLLYLDGVVRLGGDTSITANDVFIGPDATLLTCYDLVTAGNNCTNGRSLSITASGGVAISPAIDLRGLVGTNRPGGSLGISAARVSLGGLVETAGTNAGSGAINISSPGFVVTQTLRAPGNYIAVRGAAGVLVGGDVLSAGTDAVAQQDPVRQTSGGAIEISSSAGDVSVLGAIASFGRDTPGAGPVQGGNAGPVTVIGGDVRVSGAVDSHAGRGVDNTAGLAGAITLGARGSLVVSGAATASGGVSTSSFGSSGAPVVMSAGGSLVAGSVSSAGGLSTNLSAGAGGNVSLSAGAALSAGAISTAGSNGAYGGASGGAVKITAASVATGAITTDAGDATSGVNGGYAGPGGAVTVKATGTAGVGAVSARGGSGNNTGLGGAGGQIAITGERITTGSITALGENLSAPGGSVSLVSNSALLVGGAIDTSGGAGGNGLPGGAAGGMLLITRGPLTLGGRLRSEGGLGSNGAGVGAPGGNGGPVTLVVQSIAASTGVLTGGGNGGNASAMGGLRGRGGDGGQVRVWAQLPSLTLLQLVDSTGGTGDPNGNDGPQQEESAPTGLAISKTNVLSFTSHSPDAEGYQVLVSLAGAPVTGLLTTKASSVPLPKVTPCVKADYSLLAYHSGVGWRSDPIGPVSFMAAPSDTQACTDAPQVTFGVEKLKKKVKPLRKKKWRVPVRFLADGMGTARVVLSRKKKQLVVVDKPLAAARRNVSVTLTIPKKLRKAGKFTVTVTGSAPLGKARSKSTLTLEVKK